MNQYKIISSYADEKEITLTNEEELKEILRDFLRYGNNVVIIEFPDEGVLTIGVGTPYGFVEYMNEDRSPPYLVATRSLKNEREDSYVEFDSGGTPTPIPLKYCLLFENVVEIAMYYQRNKKLPENVNWEEI